MELKRIVRAAVRRWREKQRARDFNGRTAAPAPYKEEEGTALPEKAATSAAPAARMEERLAGFLDGRYEFRFNLLAEVTEFRPKDGEGLPFRTATDRDLNALCLEAHRGGVPCWDRDLMRMVHSTRVPAYHPFRLYFERLPQWDGREPAGAGRKGFRRPALDLGLPPMDARRRRTVGRTLRRDARTVRRAPARQRRTGHGEVHLLPRHPAP